MELKLRTISSQPKTCSFTPRLLSFKSFWYYKLVFVTKLYEISNKQNRVLKTSK